MAPLPPLPPHCHRRCRAATAIAMLPPPLPPCHPAARRRCAAATAAAAPPKPPLRCRHRTRAADAAATLPAVAAPLPRCLCCSADAATLLPLTPRFGSLCRGGCCRRAAAVLKSPPPPPPPPQIRPCRPMNSSLSCGDCGCFLCSFS
jgi:hypothetical protein